MNTEELVAHLNWMKDVCAIEGRWSDSDDLALEEIVRRVRAADQSSAAKAEGPKL